MVALTVYATLIDVDALGTPVEHVRVEREEQSHAASGGAEGALEGRNGTGWQGWSVRGAPRFRSWQTRPFSCTRSGGGCTSSAQKWAFQSWSGPATDRTVKNMVNFMSSYVF